MIAPERIPHLIKYMGSKREILYEINEAIKELYVDSSCICDLFSGTAVVSAAFLDQYEIISNDIQQYSGIFANTYSANLAESLDSRFSEIVVSKAEKLVNEFYTLYPQYHFDYSEISSYEDLLDIEKRQQILIKEDFDIGFSLFVKNYSGTYWSYEQCVWIDSLRAVAEDFKGTVGYYAILSALIFAMSYTSQSTGHFAQYRDVTHQNVEDILLYRKKDILPLFVKKLDELNSLLNTTPVHPITVTSLDYLDCLRIIPENSIVYADPPYSAVHYSRFYHVIETLVRYDHPHLEYKGRYRDDRHQSPFDKRKEVAGAFRLLFNAVDERKSHLVLSYSDNGLMNSDDLLEIGKQTLGDGYDISLKSRNYIHSKMGRSDENRLGVHELLISFRRR